jgi:transcriptional regulator with XRE-family HTH domain
MVDPGASSAACLGAVLRRLRTLQGLTQAGLGGLAGYDGSYLSAVERAAVRPSRELVERCDRALGADGALLMVWSLADPTERAPATGGAEPAPEVPAPDDGPVPDRAVFEAVEVARLAEASGLGPGTLAGIERAVGRLRDAAATPPQALLPAVLAQLRYAGRLLEARPTLRQHRRLLVAAGWLSLLAARLWFDAGDREAAEASRDAASGWPGRPGTPSWPPGRSRRWPCGRWPTAAPGTRSSWPGPARTWLRRPAPPPSSWPSTRPRPGRRWASATRPRGTAPGRPDPGHAPGGGVVGTPGIARVD